MARERFSFDDTIEFDKDELKPNNDIHANHTGKFTFDDEVKEKKVANPKKKKRKLKIWHVVLTLFVVAVVAFFLYIFVFSGNNNGPVYGERCVKLLSVDKNAITQVESQIEQDENIQDVAIKVSCRTIKLTYQLSDNIQVDTAKSLVENSLHTFDDAMEQSKEDGAAWSQLLNKANGRLQYDLEIIVNLMVKVISHYLEQNMQVLMQLPIQVKMLKIKHQQIKQFKDKQKSMQQIKLPQIIINKRAQLVFWRKK